MGNYYQHFVGFGTVNDKDAQVLIRPRHPGVVGLLIAPSCSGTQTANLFEVQNSSGVTTFSVDADGNTAFTAILTGDVDIDGTLTVTGNSTMGSAAIITGNTRMTGTLNVTGDAQFATLKSSVQLSASRIDTTTLTAGTIYASIELCGVRFDSTTVTAGTIHATTLLSAALVNTGTVSADKLILTGESSYTGSGSPRVRNILWHGGTTFASAATTEILENVATPARIGTGLGWAYDLTVLGRTTGVGINSATLVNSGTNYQIGETLQLTGAAPAGLFLTVASLSADGTSAIETWTYTTRYSGTRVATGTYATTGSSAGINATVAVVTTGDVGRLCAYTFTGVTSNIGGTATYCATATSVLYESPDTCAVTISPSADYLKIEVLGPAGNNMNWVASGRITEI